MTEKRFTSEVFDDGLFRIEKITDNADEVCYKETDDVVDVLNELNDENNHIKQTIQEAYESERTQIGKNVLKQLLEAIQ